MAQSLCPDTSGKLQRHTLMYKSTPQCGGGPHTLRLACDCIHWGGAFIIFHARSPVLCSWASEPTAQRRSQDAGICNSRAQRYCVCAATEGGVFDDRLSETSTPQRRPKNLDLNRHEIIPTNPSDLLLKEEERREMGQALRRATGRARASSPQPPAVEAVKKAHPPPVGSAKTEAPATACQDHAGISDPGEPERTLVLLLWKLASMLFIYTSLLQFVNIYKISMYFNY